MLTRVDGHGLTQRSGRSLEQCLGDVMRIVAVVQHLVQVDPRIGRHRLPEDLDQLGVELADLLGRIGHALYEPVSYTHLTLPTKA